MSRRGALPTRILIPLANPRTAADLVRIGAALLEHGGVVTALSIVEVPEGMPLSEGATRARQARRLLQRVLEFAPDGIDLRTVVRIGRRAAEGVVELAAEEEADLIIFGWAGRPPGRREEGDAPVFSSTIDEVVRDAPCDIAVVKQRGIGDVRRILVPVRVAPTPSSRSVSRPRSAGLRCRGRCPPRRGTRPRSHRSGRRPSGRSPCSSGSTPARPRCRSLPKARMWPPRSCAPRPRPTWS